MYKIDPTQKKLTALTPKTFNDLGFWERFDLQECLVNSPSVLGEELLVIQKEYAGFAYTNERLDLLALVLVDVHIRLFLPRNLCEQIFGFLRLIQCATSGFLITYSRTKNR